MSDGGEIARLRWRCRRGMRELDLIVTRWLDDHYAQSSANERAAFERLLDAPDPILLGWLTGRVRPHDEALAGLVDAIRATD